MTHKAASATVTLSPDGKSITVRVPLALRRIGGRKLVVTPEGELPWAPARPVIDGPLVNALARAFRWKNLLDTGRYATVDELASAVHDAGALLCCATDLLALALLRPPGEFGADMQEGQTYDIGSVTLKSEE